jgi:MFS family permease
MAFIAVGLPGVLIAAALALVSHKTPRSAHRSAIAELGLLAALRLLLGNRTLMWLITLSGVYAFTIFGPIAWLPAFFVRSHGLPLSVVGLWAGLTIGLGMACANLISGPLADRMARRGPERPLLLGLAAILLSSLAFIAVLLTGSPRWAFAWTFVAALSGSIGSPIIASTIQNECPAELRATAASMGTLAVSLHGIGLAPFAIGVMSDALASSHGADSLRAALLASLCAGPITAAMYFRVARLPLTRAAASLAESPAHA